MKFGEAIEALKLGESVTREAWGDDRTKISPKQEGGVMVGQWMSKDHPAQTYHPNWSDMSSDDWKIIE